MFIFEFRVLKTPIRIAYQLYWLSYQVFSACSAFEFKEMLNFQRPFRRSIKSFNYSEKNNWGVIGIRGS